MEYLNEEKHYLDLYDLFTIKRCLRRIEFWKKAYKKHSNEKELENLTEEEKLKDFNKILGMELYFTKISEYERKRKTIGGWIEKDRIKQDKYDNTPEPKEIYCSDCDSEMHSTLKHLENYMDEPLRVLFFFECPSCKKRKGIYDNGEEHISKPQLCTKCKKEVEVTYKKRRKVITWTYKCKSCGFTEAVVDDFEKKSAKWEKEKQEDKKLLKKYRKEFCLSDKEGKKGIETMEAMEVADVVRKEEMQKYDNSVYARSLQLKKTNISDLEKLLVKSLEKSKYAKLSFDKPEIGQYVIVPFTVQDLDSSRKDRASVFELEKLIKDALEDTNWRLLSNNTTYRLGYVEGRLKGHEREEDMLKLAGKKKETKPKSKIDEAKRQKYASNNLVQLAKLFGQHDGIENMRKRRLAKEPEGFFLEASEGPYSCGICGEHYHGNEMWWNLDGLRCVHCWRNIKEGVISSLKHRHDDDSSWFQNWQIHSDYGVHPATRGKLRREGLLVGRDLKKPDGTIYCTVYLVSENKEFLKKYPKQDSKIKMEFVGSGNKRVQL